MSDLRIALDAALGLLMATALTELLIKPMPIRTYRLVDRYFKDNLPDLP